MQTFLPYADFAKSAGCLDDLRLGNQCYRETKTLLNGGWQNHPASKMWRGYEYSLCEYGKALARELSLRGRTKIGERWHEYYSIKQQEFADTGSAPWLGDEAFHASHRSNLLRKDPEWYGKFGWSEDSDLPYIWP